MHIKRSALLLSITAAVAVAAQPAAQAQTSGAARACSGVTVDGQKTPVRATGVSCAKARKIARRFAVDGHLPRGWDSVNPAGCEHVIFRARDRGYVLSHQYRAPGGAPLINAVKFRGCNS
jgi:uncharacterized membrane protein